jgi:hypothetical protein
MIDPDAGFVAALAIITQYIAQYSGRIKPAIAPSA